MWKIKQISGEKRLQKSKILLKSLMHDRDTAHKVT